MFLFRLILLLSLATVGCKKAANRTCIKSSGKSVHEVTYFEEINRISVSGDINIVIIQDGLNFIAIDSYENIVNHVSIRFENHELKIKNENKCRFLRNYDKQTTLKIHVSNLNKIELYGKGKIETQNTIINPSFHLYSHSSNSEINLAINTNNLTVEFVNGTINGQISGSSQEAYIFHSGYSNVNFIDLETDNLFVRNKSYSDTYVNASTMLSTKIENTGNIYYKGNPTLGNTTTLSSGKLLKYTE